MRINTNQINISFDDGAVSVTSNDGELTAGDFFAGGGGVTDALYKMKGVRLKWILNHDKIAVKTNIFHHKGIKHYWSNVFTQDEHELEPVDFFWASYECTQHSPAKGGGETKIGSYMMGWELYRYAKYLQPLVIGVENVPAIKKWAPLDVDGKPDKTRKGQEFLRWKAAMMDLGYEYQESIRNAADDGLPTRRVRYFAYFYRPGINISFPAATHAKVPTGDLLPWNACRPYIDTDNHGESIFGRAHNENILQQHRKPYVDDSIQRIIGGIRKHAPEIDARIKEVYQFIVQYYGKKQSQSISSPLNTVRTNDCHQLITLEKIQFIQDHCYSDKYHTLDEPMAPQLARETKQLVSFIAHNYSSNGNPGANVQSLDFPLNAITTGEKIQFITAYYNSGGRPDTQHQSLDDPLNTVTTSPTKKQLITLLNGFDIKARFLTREELAEISTFDRYYFSAPELKLSNRNAIRMIGNAVPPEWARVLIEPIVPTILEYKNLYRITA